MGSKPSRSRNEIARLIGSLLVLIVVLSLLWGFYLISISHSVVAEAQ